PTLPLVPCRRATPSYEYLPSVSTLRFYLLSEIYLSILIEVKIFQKALFVPHTPYGSVRGFNLPFDISL
ncbi:MAG: hypothetical protein ACP5QP_07250, partial [Brevinematia bacterium]